MKILDRHVVFIKKFPAFPDASMQNVSYQPWMYSFLVSSQTYDQAHRLLYDTLLASCGGIYAKQSALAEDTRT